MPRTNFTDSPAISKAGWGHQGYCRLCSIKDPKLQKQLNERVSLGPKPFNAWMLENIGIVVNRQTMYSHRDHVMNPKDRIVTAVERQRRTGVLPAKVTEDQLLDAITTAGYQKVVENPEDVSIDHALRAVAIRKQDKAQTSSIQTLIAIFAPRDVVPQLESGVIEGEVREIS